MSRFLLETPHSGFKKRHCKSPKTSTFLDFDGHKFYMKYKTNKNKIRKLFWVL